MIDSQFATLEEFNRTQWAENHQGFKYFAEHSDYGHPTSTDSLADDTWIYDAMIRGRYGIVPDGKLVCEIGVGYGRLSANFTTAKHVFGIDVSQELFRTTSKYLESKGFSDDDFTLLLSDQYKENISQKGDFVFSFIVFQHIPKSFQVDYLQFFANWLNPGGEMLIQFLVADSPDCPMGAEPCFFWRVPELFEVVCGLPLVLNHFDVGLVIPGVKPVYWAWVHLTKGA